MTQNIGTAGTIPVRARRAPLAGRRDEEGAARSGEHAALVQTGCEHVALPDGPDRHAPAVDDEVSVPVGEQEPTHLGWAGTAAYWDAIAAGDPPGEARHRAFEAHHAAAGPVRGPGEQGSAEELRRLDLGPVAGTAEDGRGRA